MLRPAQREEAEILTEISFSSKRYWKYPEEYFRIWDIELTISPGYIGRGNDVWVYENDREIFAYYCLVTVKKEIKIGDIIIACRHWLEHMFIRFSHNGLELEPRCLHICTTGAFRIKSRN